MDTKLTNGDFALGPTNHPVLVGGLEEVAQQIRIRLTVPRGKFSPNPQLGSRLREIPRGTREEMSQWARYAIEEALIEMPQVALETAACGYDPAEDRAKLDCVFRVAAELLAIDISL